ncbi:MAG TPA: MarR family transcriptional regulator, partial [Vicinamibacteria bacterium]
SLALSVWVRLLRAHGLVLQSVRRRLPRGITLPQFDVLAQLQRHPDGLLPSELTEALLVTAGNVTGIVRRLEAQGVLERSRVPHDRRAVRLRLTERGRTLMTDLLPAHALALEEILAPVPREELVALRECLGAFARALEGPHEA